MSELCNIPHPLSRQGTSQPERLPDALDKKYVKLDERKLIDLVKQSAEFSKYIAFYGSNDDKNAISDWSVFFKEIYANGKCSFTKIEELQKGEVSPHVALFLAFLQLFETLQDNLNELTEQHLRLFYEEILQLKYKPAIVDNAIVFAELAKTQEYLKIEKGTKLLAGKDAKGQPRLYETSEEVIVNQAQVSDLKTIFVKKNKDNAVEKITATQKADTADGLAEPISENPASWSMFGDENQKTVTEIGFAIASPIFNLSEGQRTITLSGFSADALKNLTIQYTSPNGWEEIKDNSGIIIKPDQPAFVAYNAEKHTGKAYNTKNPILKITLKDHSFYTTFNEIKPDIIVTVKVEGCKNLILSNDLGEIDPSKSFFPFGSRPVAESSSLIIGYPSAFNKYLKSFSLNPVGKPAASYTNVFDGKLFSLVGGNWVEATFDKNSFANEYDNNDLEFNTQTKNNFIKVVLGKHYDYDEASKKYTKYIALVASGNPPKDEVFPPQIPELASLTLNYDLETTLKTDPSSTFFHIHPFGVQAFIEAVPTKLLPTFSDEGTLCIGIEKLKKGQTLSLHFQLHEGSGDSDSETSEIKWCFLQNNTLFKIESYEIIKDSTNRLTTSGIVRFSLPPKAFEAGNTVLSADKIWIFATCAKDSGAYPKIIAIKSQAVECSFFDQKNDTSHFEKGLEAGSITKVEVPIEGLKKIEQLFPSFGGQNAESVDAYKTRTSELLRHKNRAWNIWDYERMVLEQFPSIYKAKCISHSTRTTEYAPKNVLLVVLPYLENVLTQNKLQPKVSIGEREKIKTFLGKYVSPFVEIEVINPVYEEIQVTAHVSIHARFDKAFYGLQLIEDLKKFLSPWLRNKEDGLRFEGELYQSAIINYIEEREYVNYISFFEVQKIVGRVSLPCSDHIKVSNQSAILTSYSTHSIDTDTTC